MSSPSETLFPFSFDSSIQKWARDFISSVVFSRVDLYPPPPSSSLDCSQAREINKLLSKSADISQSTLFIEQQAKRKETKKKVSFAKRRRVDSKERKKVWIIYFIDSRFLTHNFIRQQAYASVWIILLLFSFIRMNQIFRLLFHFNV